MIDTMPLLVAVCLTLAGLVASVAVWSYQNSPPPASKRRNPQRLTGGIK